MPEKQTVPEIRTAKSVTPSLDTLFDREYSAEEKERYGQLSTAETEKSLRSFVVSYWEAAAEKPDVPEMFSIDFLKSLAQFVGDNFLFDFDDEKSYGIATIQAQLEQFQDSEARKKQLTANLKAATKLLATFKDLPKTTENEQRHEEVLQEYYSALDEYNQFEHEYIKKFDCKFPAAVLAYLLEYLREKYHFSYEIFLMGMSNSPHLRVLFKQIEEKPDSRHLLRRILHGKLPFSPMYWNIDYHAVGGLPMGLPRAFRLNADSIKGMNENMIQTTSWQGLRAFDVKMVRTRRIHNPLNSEAKSK